MPVHYINRKSQKYYLHQSSTSKGKPKYFFSMKSGGTSVDKIPDDHEIYENVNAQVFLRKKQRKIISDAEVALVEEDLKLASKTRPCRLEVKKNAIIIYEANQDYSILAELRVISSGPRAIDPEKFLARILSYTPMMKFVLVDEEQRIFIAQRYCFRGSIDDWIEIGKPDLLPKLVKQYVKHLGRDSFYELL